MRRRTIIGVAAVLMGGLVAGAAAWAFGPHGPGRHAVMKRFVSAEIDEVLDRAQATPEQRTAIHGARDRVFAAVEAHVATRQGRVDEMLALFEADRIDTTRAEALRQQAEQEHRKMADAFTQAVVEAHDVLNPAQRRVVTEYIRSHRWGH